MASTTAAGTTIDISAGKPATQTVSGYSALTYTNIGGVEQLGAIGANTAKVEFQPLSGAKQKHKGSTDYGTLTPSLAHDKGDAGQTLLRTFCEPDNNELASIRVTYPTGDKRYFQARGFGYPENVGGADSIIMANPSLEINTKIVKDDAV